MGFIVVCSSLCIHFIEEDSVVAYSAKRRWIQDVSVIDILGQINVVTFGSDLYYLLI